MRSGRLRLALAALVAIACAAFVPWPVFDDPAPDICAYWWYTLVVVAWFVGVPVLALAAASVRWRGLRGIALAILIGALVGSSVGVVIARVQADRLVASERCD